MELQSACISPLYKSLNKPKIYAIYNAKGTIFGEISFIAKKCMGLTECALCDISHGWNILGKGRWREAKGLLADIEWIHADEQSDELKTFTSGRLPCVVMHSKQGLSVLMGNDALSALGGDMDAFESALQNSLDAVGN